ncbi:MAG: sulfur oxidation c-type cytochrome SoxX [Proteobacteria bacterium]|nr:sulfur oxidation c-type cytochrome SoxX [Pseudomonadota bacterium]MDA1332162.1 sulfur oxidation c-type cytochrome SoxX [Pseudomonadota bacterium]
MKNIRLILDFIVALLMLGLTVARASEEMQSQVNDLLKEGLRSKGPVQLERFLNLDATQKFCSASNVNINSDEASQLMAEAQRQIQYPADGIYIGDWKEGERIAQSGKGLRFDDANDGENGGNCYACHQIRKDELSYGTLGPSLYQFGKLRGYSDEVLRYTWAKIFNSQAFLMCSNMPRYGYKGILTVEQMRNIMGLLLDPQSPVNE